MSIGDQIEAVYTGRVLIYRAWGAGCGITERMHAHRLKRSDLLAAPRNPWSRFFRRPA